MCKSTIFPPLPNIKNALVDRIDLNVNVMAELFACIGVNFLRHGTSSFVLLIPVGEAGTLESSSLALGPGVLLIQIHEFNDVADGDCFPVTGDQIAPVIDHGVSRHNRARLADNDRAGVAHVDCRGIRHPNPKWLKGAVVQLSMQIVVGHANILTMATTFHQRLVVSGGLLAYHK
jgi:hypothetical protein